MATVNGEFYEGDADVIGEVRVADLDGLSFSLRLWGGHRITGCIPPGGEASLLEALRDHANRRLRVRGRAEYRIEDGRLIRFLRVDELEVSESPREEGHLEALSLGEFLSNVGAGVAAQEWEPVPTDLAMNLDHYLYGSPKADK